MTDHGVTFPQYLRIAWVEFEAAIREMVPFLTPEGLHATIAAIRPSSPAWLQLPEDLAGRREVLRHDLVLEWERRAGCRWPFPRDAAPVVPDTAAELFGPDAGAGL